MKVYTKTGDGGTTALIGGERVSKADLRVEAYGSVDELAAHLALLGDMMREAGAAGVEGFEKMTAAIEAIQRMLMLVEAILATGSGGQNKLGEFPDEAIEKLEAGIDAMSEGLPPLKGFTLPGGHRIVSQAHVARTVCRRAERATVRASEQYPIPPAPARYLNRLSDWLYVAGRKAVVILNAKETYWIP